MRRAAPLIPVPTPETKRPALKSVYAIGKYVQERLTLTLTQQYGMEGVALRLWNVYGPGQSLSNPYTGVLAIFASRIANGQRPLVFEDGRQRRDFVHVDDVADAFVLALRRQRRAAACSTSAPARTAPSMKSRGCRPQPWAGRTSRPRSSARRAPATSATTSPIFPRARAPRLRAEEGLRRRPGRTGGMGCAPESRGPGRRGAAGARNAGAGRVSISTDRPDHRRRRLHRQQPRRPAGDDGPRGYYSDSLARAGVERNLAWLQGTAWREDQTDDRRRARRRRPCARRGWRGGGLPSGRAGGGDHQPGSIRWRTSRSTSPAPSTCWRPHAARGRGAPSSSPAPTRSTATSPTCR